jgi:Cof subfamily protein (haloacid dehalogenase superfamily)
MDISLVAIDLDDTLLDSGLQVSPECQRALRQVGEQGVMVTLATGRMFRSAVKYARFLARDLPLITYQGALVKKAVSGEEIYHKVVPCHLAHQVLDMVRETGCHFQAYFDDLLHMERLTPEGQDYAAMSGVTPVIDPALPEMIERRPTTKLLFIDEPQRLIALEQQLKSVFSGQLYITRSKPNYLEIMNYEATKGRALQAVCDYYHLSREQVMAVGDSYNDMDMLSWAGVGVAMANAPEEVKKVADFITASNDDDGVAQALRHFFALS